MRHKHADLIHQMAEGAVIQYEAIGGWMDCPPGQFWDSGMNLRVKPGTENSGLPPGAVVVGPSNSGESPLNDKSHPRFIQGYHSGMLDARLSALSDSKSEPVPQRTQLTVREQFAMEAMKIFLADRGAIIEFGSIAKLNGVEIEFILSAATSRIADAMLKASGVSDV